MRRKTFSIALAILAVLAFLFLAYRAPDSIKDFEPVSPSTIQFQSISDDGSFKPSLGVPLVEAALGKSFYTQNFDGVYNKFTMRCRFQILSGLSQQASLERYRILLVTSKEKLLLNLHLLGESVVSDNFVCVRDADILSLPGVKEVKMTDGDHLKAALVSHLLDTEQSHPTNSASLDH